MFSKVAFLALLAPLVSALTLNVPQNPTSDGTVTVTWTATTNDVIFSLFLINEAFHDSFGIANNVDPSLQTLTLTLPSVPVRDGYTLRATNVGNITDVFADSGSFSVGAATQSSTIASSTASGSSSVSGSGSGSAAPSTTRPATGSTSSFGVIVTSSSGASGSSASGASASSSGSSAGSSPSPSAFNGASQTFGVGTVAAAVLSVVAGAAVFAF